MRRARRLVSYLLTGIALSAVLYVIVNSIFDRELARFESGVWFAIAAVCFGGQALINYWAGDRFWIPFGDHMLRSPEGDLQHPGRWVGGVIAFLYVFFGLVALLAFLSVKLTS